MRADGTCPVCGRAVEPGRAHERDAVDASESEHLAAVAATTATAADVDADGERPSIPWHLWLLLAALAVYLGYRAFQGLEWLFGF